MKTQPQHTPTPKTYGEETANIIREMRKQKSSARFQIIPLRIGKRRESDNEIEIIALDKKGGRIIASVCPQPFFNDHQEETADLIVRAVNSHEALLDALKTWQKFWDKMPKGQMGKLSFDVGLFNDGFVKMDKAIAQAEGE